MKVAFLLPNYSGHVVGSTSVYYNFARELAARGHLVDVFHPGSEGAVGSPLQNLRSRLWAVKKSLLAKPVPWFDFPYGVRPWFRPWLEGLDLGHDFVVAFSWKAVEALAGIRVRGEAVGYIVEYETWAEADPARKARMEAAYRNGLPMLCSSKVVESMLHEVGVSDVRLCVHGVDIELNRVRTPVEQRAPGRIGFPIRMEPVKSPEVLEAALRLLRARFGTAVSLWGFGHGSAPAAIVDLLDDYHVHPSDSSLAALYDGSAIFAVPSRKEGFGMPAAEAMSSGCAVVSTDNGGISTFGVDGENCLIVPAGSPDALADAVGELVTDPARRIGLAHRAPDSVRFLRWTEAGERLVRRMGV